MRKSLWIMLAVLLVAIGAPNAHADSFTYTYTGTAPSFGFDYSWTTEAISGVTMQTTVPAADLTATSTSGITGCVITSVILNASGLGNNNTNLGGCFLLEVFGNDLFAPSDYITPGTYVGNSVVTKSTMTVTRAVAMPEPSSVALMLLGVGLVFVMRKRIGQSLPQAS
jgi:hypothetical protein